MSRLAAAARLAKVPKQTVWSEMTPLAVECAAVNLGQGFPNFAPPDFLLDNVREATQSSANPLNHQYCRSLGHPTLVGQLQTYYSAELARKIDPAEVCVTSGVTQGLNIVFQAIINPGDEVITFEPAFDLYANDIEMAGGVVKFASMTPKGTTADEWAFDPADVEALVTPQTKAILLNTPQNVPGKVWSAAELESVAAIAIKHDLFVVSDEVYARLVYDGLTHTSIARLPGMFERTFTLCSAGKTFACTGYKVGWIVADKGLIVACNQVQSHQTFCITTPMQIAVGNSFQHANEHNNGAYFKDLVAAYEHRRALLCGILRDVGLPPVMPSGGFFILADISQVDPKHYLDANDTTGVGKDWQFCRWLTRVIGVNAIPVTAFCTKDARPLYEKFARFAICKKEEDIVAGGKRLLKLKEFMLS